MLYFIKQKLSVFTSLNKCSIYIKIKLPCDEKYIKIINEARNRIWNPKIHKQFPKRIQIIIQTILILKNRKTLFSNLPIEIILKEICKYLTF